MLNSVYIKIFHNLQRWKAVFTLLLIFVPVLLIAHKGINNPKTLQLLNKSSKSHFFIENRGQWPKQVKFLARLGGMNCWITDSGVVYDYYRIDRNYSPDSIMMLLSHEKDEFERSHTSCKGQVVRMDYEGIYLNAEKQGLDKREAYYNYFIGNDSTKWASFVGLYGEVLVKDAYPGIDIRYYFDSGQIRYDYLVDPGANISQISFRLTGADDIAVNESGELIIQTSLGEVKHGKLYSYQQYGNEKKEVSCRFERNVDGRLFVRADHYDKGLALVIDPLVWSTFLGGSSSDECLSFSKDQNDNMFITGRTSSWNYPTTTGAFQRTYNVSGMYDIYVTKINLTGSSLIFSTFIGGSDFDYGLGIKVDTFGNSYIAGRTASTNLPVTSTAYQTHINSAEDAFIIKLNSNGSTLIYSTYLGGWSFDGANHLDIDSKGYAYIVGSTTSSGFPTTIGAYQTSLKGTTDAFVAKLNQNGSRLVYSTYLGGNNYDNGINIKVDNSGNAYIVGCTSSLNYPITNGAYQTSFPFGLSYDGFISKFNSTGTSLIFSTFLGASGNINQCNDIALIGSTGFVVTGITDAHYFPTTIGAYHSTYHAGTIFGFISQFNISGTTLTYSALIGGNNGGATDGNTPTGIVIDAFGNKIISGYTNSTNYPVTKGAYQKNNNSNPLINIYYNDAFISKLSPDLSYLIYSSYIGGSADDQVISDIAVDTNNNVYIAGRTTSSNFPTTSGSYSTTYSGSSGMFDAFALKLGTINQASNIYFPNISCSQMDIHWQKGNGANNVVFMKEGNSGYPVPLNNTKYTADTVFGSGSQIDTSGWFCIYYGSDKKVKVSGLIFNTTYRIMVLVDTGSIGNELYNCDSTFHNPMNHLSGSNPIANYIINDSIQCQKGNNFVFNNKSTTKSGTLSNMWLFGDGDTSFQKNPIYNYSVPDTFNVKLLVSSGINCSDSISKTVYVNPSPTAFFSINDSAQCLKGNNFILTNNSTIQSGTFSQKWDFADGSITVSYDASHSYGITDSYMIKLLIVSDWACKDSIMKKVVIHPDQTTSFNVTDSTVCIGEVVNFNNTSANNYGTLLYKWDFGDCNSAGIQNPQHSYASDSIYNVKLTSTSNFGCKDSVFHKIYVNPFPKTDFTINDTSQCLTGNSFTFTDNSSIKSGSIIQTYFNLGDGTTSLFPLVTHSYVTSDTFFVKLSTKSNEGCSDSVTKAIYVWPIPTAGFSINTNPQNLTGNNFVFTTTSVIPSGNLKYYWNFGDGDTSSASNPVHSFTAAGSYKVIMIATSDFGCADTFTDSVFVLNNPGIVVSFTTNNACVGEEVLFKNTSTVIPPDSFMNFSWDFGDGNQTIVRYDPKHIYSSPGTYIITLGVLTAFGYKDSLIDTLEIYPSPAVDITAIPDTIAIPGRPVTLTANGTYDQLLWWNNTTQQTVVVLTEGKYWVTATFNNGCKSSDTIELTKGENKEFEVMNVITPNGDGINDMLVIKNIDLIKPCKLSIYNRWGDELFSSSNYQNNWDGTFKGKSLPEGTYYYVLETKDGKVYKGPVNILRN